MDSRNKIINISLSLVILFTTGVALSAQDSTDRFVIPIKNWNLKIVSGDKFYPTYLADPLGVRIGLAFLRMKYSDYDVMDKINDGGPYRGRDIVNPGIRFSFLKFTPQSNPALGAEMEVGVTIPTIMREANRDLVGVDGIFYFAIAGKPTEWLSLRFSKHHICTHIGDEFPYRVFSVTDSDPNISQLPVRDDFILSAAAKPLYFLGRKDLNILMLYGDFGFFLPGIDFLGVRQNKPNLDAYLNLQGGVEIEYYLPNKYMGGVFTAFNVSSYQLNAFSPNINAAIGYILPQERNRHRFRIGLNYYNGRAWSNQFFNRKEKAIGFFVETEL